MENRIIIMAVTVCALLSSCWRNNPKERNRLVFVDSKEDVSNSVRDMDIILWNKNNKTMEAFVVDSNNLYVGDSLYNVHKVGALSDPLLYQSNYLYFIDETNRERFVRLVSFLNKNYLGWAYFRDGQFLYQYRADIDMGDLETDLERFVVVVNSEQEIDFNRYKILDRYKNLYLLANKDAEIWSSE